MKQRKTWNKKQKWTYLFNLSFPNFYAHDHGSDFNRGGLNLGLFIAICNIDTKKWNWKYDHLKLKFSDKTLKSWTKILILITVLRTLSASPRCPKRIGSRRPWILCLCWANVRSTPLAFRSLAFCMTLYLSCVVWTLFSSSKNCNFWRRDCGGSTASGSCT